MEPLDQIRLLDEKLLSCINDRVQLLHTLFNQEATSSGSNTQQRKGLEQILQDGIDRSISTGKVNNLVKAIQDLYEPQDSQKVVGFLGPDATFTHEAAIKLFGDRCSYKTAQNVPEIFQSLVQGKLDYGVVPIENSIGGPVIDTLDCFIKYDCKIIKELHLLITQNLLANIPLADVKQVISHPQALMQCKEWLHHHLPFARLVESSSTAAGVKQAQQESGAASIACKLAASYYGMNILAESIQDLADNVTRFLVIIPAENHSQEAVQEVKTSIVLSLQHKPGVLKQVLEALSEESINILSLESRPSKEKSWEYLFFMDLEGSLTNFRMHRAIEKIANLVIWVKILGSYIKDG